MKNTLKTILAACAILLMSWAARADENKLYELRTYHASPGKLEALQARFRDHTIAIFEKHGMTNVGYWVPKDNADNLLIYMLSYPDKAARDASWKAFSADPEWKNAKEESEKDGKLVMKVDNLFLTPTDYSPSLSIAATDPPRLFELRQYTTNEGKLVNLDARFRDHTVSLFTRHGLTNVAYFHPIDGQPAAGHTLVYFLAHKDEDSRTAGFDAFRQDPDWQSAREESEKDGKLLVNKGVQSTLLVPTDFSPLK